MDSTGVPKSDLAVRRGGRPRDDSVGLVLRRGQGSRNRSLLRECGAKPRKNRTL